MNLTLTGTVDHFNEDLFKQRLAALLEGVVAEDIEIRITAGSIQVSATIRFADSGVAGAAFTTLSDLAGASTSAVEAQLGNHFSVETVDPPTMTLVSGDEVSPTPPGAATGLDGKGGDNGLVGIIIGVLGALGLLALLCVLGRRWMRRSRAEKLLKGREYLGPSTEQHRALGFVDSHYESALSSHQGGNERQYSQMSSGKGTVVSSQL